MKKITLFVTLFISALGYSQTFAVYTEDPAIGTGTTITGWVSNNAPGFGSVAEIATNNFEGSSHRFLDYVGAASEWYMSTATGTTADLTSYSTGYYNIAIKTSSQSSFWLRLKGGGNSARVTSAVLANYGFVADGNWHFLSFPVSEFVSYGATPFNIAAVTEFFVLRSDLNVTGTENDFEVDNIYFSTSQVLKTKDFKTNNISMYPNPASSEVSFSALNSIDSIVVHNLLGQKVLETSPKSTSANVNIGSLASGAYVVTLITEGKTLESKLLKK
jgi:Secretion system C-terminal sorting domain